MHFLIWLKFSIFKIGLTDLLLHYGYPLPEGSDYMTLSLASGIEALLFIFHLHGRLDLFDEYSRTSISD